jgi:lipopolysaccharide transport system permease protein
MAGIYVLIFSSVSSPADPVTGNPVHFGLYVFAGMLPWFTLQESLQRSTTVLIDYAHLVRHHTIPLYILPFQIVLSATGSGIMAVIVFLLLKSVIGGLPDFHALLLIAVLPMQILFCSGLSLLLSTTTVFIRDISHMTMAMLTIWFFASPIVFPLDSLPWLLKVPWLNPLVSLTQIYRDLLLFNRLPDWNILLLFAGFTVLSLIVGSFFYQKTHREIVDWV